MSDRMANSPEFRNELEKRLGTEKYDDFSQEGQQDVRKGGRYSAAEVISEFRERPDGVSVEGEENSMVAKYKALQEGGAKFNSKAQDYLSKYGFEFGNDKVASAPGEEEAAAEPPAQIEPTPPLPGDGGTSPAPPMYGGGPGSQNVNQDNDISNNISGNNNTVTNNQNNSVSGYGGESDYLGDWMSKYKLK